MMWAAGSLAAMSSIAYPAISAMVSCNADADQQGIYPLEMVHYFYNMSFLKIIWYALFAENILLPG